MQCCHFFTTFCKIMFSTFFLTILILIINLNFLRRYRHRNKFKIPVITEQNF